MSLSVEQTNRNELLALVAQHKLRVTKHAWVPTCHVGGILYRCTACKGTVAIHMEMPEHKVRRRLDPEECLGVYVDMDEPGAAARVVEAQSQKQQ